MNRFTTEQVRTVRGKITHEINSFYPKDRQNIARECLALAHMWANSEVKFSQGDYSEKSGKKKAYNDCVRYINQNLVIEPSQFAIPSFILYLVVSYLVKWVAQIIIDMIFERDYAP